MGRPRGDDWNATYGAMNLRISRMWPKTLEGREKVREYMRDWRAANQDKVEAEQARSRARYNILRAEMLLAYGGVCECCGEDHKEFLGIDHIYGGGRTERKKYAGSTFLAKLAREGWPKDNYRLLCHNCNLSLGAYGYCPHRTEGVHDDKLQIDRSR